MKAQKALARSAILDAATRPIVIVLLDPVSDAGLRFFQDAMEPLDVAVALRMMIRRAPVRDAEPPPAFLKAKTT